jgi:hypothetical protein
VRAQALAHAGHRHNNLHKAKIMDNLGAQRPSSSVLHRKLSVFHSTKKGRYKRPFFQYDIIKRLCQSATLEFSYCQIFVCSLQVLRN